MSNKSGIAMAQLDYEDSQSMHEIETDLEEVIATSVEDNSKWMYDTFLMRWVCIEKQFVETNSFDSRVLASDKYYAGYRLEDSPTMMGMSDDLDSLDNVKNLRLCPSCYLYIAKQLKDCDYCK
jgi:hypothetical protein